MKTLVTGILIPSLILETSGVVANADIVCEVKTEAILWKRISRP